MDLRRRIGLGVVLAGLVMATAVVAWTGHALRTDVVEEIQASERLVGLLEAAAAADEAQLLALAQGPFRHVRVSTDRSVLEHPFQADTGDGVLEALARAWVAPARSVQAIRVGAQTLYVQSDPDSEIAEIVRDARHWLLGVVVFCVSSLVAVWIAVDRALAPARRLEARILALDGVTPAPAPGHFALREYRRLSQAIDCLSDKLAAARSAQRTLAQCLIKVQEDERRDIARELHDEFGQSLTAIGLSAAYVTRNAARVPAPSLVQAASDICAESSRLGTHLRQLLSRLRPHGLDGVGLIGALHACVDDWRRRAGAVAVQAELPEQLPPLAAGTALSLYRGLQEALTNVARHSRATRVDIRLRQTDGAVCLEVTDNGAGPAPEHRSARPGVGLLGMHERALMAGGRLVLERPPDGGFRVRLSLPVEPVPLGDRHVAHCAA